MSWSRSCSTRSGARLAKIAFGTQLTRFKQHARGITATLTDGATGEQRIVQAAHVVAADGAASGARDALDIAMVGPELAHSVSILFRADLATTVADRASAVYFVANPDISGVFMAVNNQHRWLFGTRYRPAAGERAEDFTAARCTDLVRKAVGLADLPVQIESVLPWTAAARVAQKFRVGRVFLAGDAAHQMTPMGAFGMNTGVQDGHNLAWKLAGVLGGWAGADLLNTYQAERQPVAIMTVEQSRKLWESGGPDNVDGNLAVVLGFAYQSTAVVLDGQAPLDELTPCARHGWEHGHPTCGFSGVVDGSQRSTCLAPASCCWRARQVGRGARLPSASAASFPSRFSLSSLAPRATWLIQPARGVRRTE